MPKGTITTLAILCVVTQHSSPPLFPPIKKKKKEMQGALRDDFWRGGVVLDQYFGIGYPGGFETLTLRVRIEREIRKRISPTRNPSSGWISIGKSRSGFHGFPFYRSIGKSKKGFAKLFSWTVVFFLLSMRACARPLFLRVFQILFRISQSNGKSENPKTDISALKSVFGFRVRFQIRNPDFHNPWSRFPNWTHPKTKPSILIPCIG